MAMALLIVFGSATAAVLGFVLLTRLVPEHWLVADGEAASAVYATIEMVYAVLLALGALAVWEPRTEAASNTEREANDLTEVYWAARVFDEPDRSAVRDLVVRYAEEVVRGEWPSLRRERQPSARAELLMAELKSRVEAVTPAEGQQEDSHDEALSRINDASDARKARVSTAASGMPGPMWPTLIIGGIVSTAFLYLFKLSRSFPNGLMLFLMGGMIALILVVIYHLEYPFSRGLGIDPDAFTQALTYMRALH